MATSRLALLLGVVLCQATRLLGCGGGYDEPVPAPPGLSQTLIYLPAKNIVQILAEEGVTWSNAPSQSLDNAQLLQDFANGPSHSLVKKMDQLLDTARVHYNGPDTVNLLHDLHDLAASDATSKEASDYVRWRLDHLVWFSRPNNVEEGDVPNIDSSRAVELDTKIATSSRTMLPFWLYLKGAMYFKEENDTDSEVYFDRVLKEFPTSPRAEPALFMKARCLISQSMNSAKGDSIREEARRLFLTYLAKYPEGKYRNDVLGWLGDNCSKSTSEALTYFIEQASDKNHPENFPKAIEKISDYLADLPESNDLEIGNVAKHPTVAFALACAALSSNPRISMDPSVDDIRWRHRLLQALGTEVLDHKNLYQGSLAKNRFLAILAHAASDEGDQEKALQFISMGNKKEENDDLAFVYPLALERQKKLDDAAAAYRDFLKHFPNSPLAKGAQYRLGLTLHDQKKDGEALLVLAELRGNQLPVLLPTQVATNASGLPNWVPTTPADILNKSDSGASHDAVNQTIDTLLNFAPLTSLQTALSGNDAEHEAFRKELYMVLKERSLASEDFAVAANFSQTDSEKQQFLDLAKRVEEFKKSTGDAAIQKGQQIRDYWEKDAVDQLPLPLDSQETLRLLFNDDAPTGNLNRISNARALNVDDAIPDMELENRIPWLHAITWNQNILKANPSGEFAPQALWRVIQDRRKFAEFSAYGLQRSLQTDAGTESHLEYDELLKQYPDSTEAKKYAVYWTIPEPLQIIQERNAPYLSNEQEWFSFHWTKALSEFADPNNHPQGTPATDQWDIVCGSLTKLPDQVRNLDQKAFASVINSLVETAKPSATAVERMAVMNCLDDLQQLSQIPNLDPEIRDQYIRLRFRVMKSAPLADTPDISALYPADQDFSDEQLGSDIAAFLQKPGTEQIRDFIDFLNSALMANHRVDIQEFSIQNPNVTNTESARDFVALASQNESFLTKYPKSPKREAARVQQLRGLVYAARPRSGSYHFDWPESVSRSGKDGPTFYHQTPLDRVAYEKALKAYYEEFSNGKYPNAVLSYRADEALMTNQWGEALDALIALHDQKSDSQFQDQVIGELPYLFDQLDRDELRQEVLAEILKRPAARNLLQTYINCGGLPYLKDYLLGRLIRS